MKVLILGLNYAPEPIGIGRFTGEMAPWLAARGHRVRVVTAPPYYPAWRVAEGYAAAGYRVATEAGVAITRCPLWVPRKRSGLRRILHLMSFACSSFPVVLWQGLVFRPDLVMAVAPALLCAPGAWAAARLSGAKAWLHIQDFEVDAAFELGLLESGPFRRLAEAVERMTLRRFDAVSTITMRMQERLVAKGVEAGKTLLFPNWADTEAVRPLARADPKVIAMRAELGIRDDDVVALYSGNLGEKQGLEVLVEVAAHVAGDPRIVILVCGQGAVAERMAGLAKGSPNLHLLPLQPAERINDLLNAADIHLLPQRAGAADLVMPSKLGAMLASGRPVVAAARQGTEVAKAVGGCGVIVAPDDAAAMADALTRLAGDAEERRRLGENARAAALADWDREKILTRLEAAALALAAREG